MNVKWLNSSSVLSWMYCGMSPSSSSNALVYGLLPLPPGTSLSWMPPSSLYCCHRSVSRISAADRNLRMAASPWVSSPPPPSANAAAARPSGPRVAPAPTASPVAKNDRRLIEESGSWATDPFAPLASACRGRCREASMSYLPLARSGEELLPQLTPFALIPSHARRRCAGGRSPPSGQRVGHHVQEARAAPDERVSAASGPAVGRGLPAAPHVGRAAALHLSSMRPKRHTASARVHVSTNRPTTI